MSKKLLLADDSVTIRKVIEITLAGGPYELTAVGDGDSAFAKAREDRPDLILADVCMPGKNGYELCAAVKKDPALRGVPVLLLTGTFEPFDEARATAAGADDWIAKPFESQALIRKVEELLARAEETPAAVPPPPQETGADDIWADLAGFDAAEAAPSEEVPDEGWDFGAAPEPAPERDDLWESVGEELPPLEEFGNDFEFEGEDLPTPLPDFDPFAAEQNGAEATDPFATSQDDASAAGGEEAWNFSPEDSTALLDDGQDEEILLLGEEDIVEDDLEPWEAEAVLPPAEEEKGAEESWDVLDDDLLPADLSPESEAADLAEEEPFVDGLLLDEEPAPAPEVPPAAAEAPAPSVQLSPLAVEEKIASLPEEELARIVEKVAGSVVERLARTMLERIAWEVVPDLAETMIKEEIRKIREEVR